MNKALNLEGICYTQKQRNPGDTNENLVNSPSAKGLCVNCDDAEICKLAGFGDEVVFCEEHSSNFEVVHSHRESNRVFVDVPNLGVKNLIPGWNA